MFSTDPLFANNSSNQPSEPDIRGIFAALQKADMSDDQKKIVIEAVTKEIGAIAVISALVGSPMPPILKTSEAITKNTEVEEEEDVEDVEDMDMDDDRDSESLNAEPIAEESDKEQVLNVQSMKQFPALPKAAPRQSPIIDVKPKKAVSPIHSVDHSEEEDCDDYSHHSHHSHEKPKPITFNNEPEPCYHFFKYGILEQNVGTDKQGRGCRFGVKCAKTHGDKTSKGRIISARTQQQIDDEEIVCLRRARDGTPCEGAHHIDDCCCDLCGSKSHITQKCATCYNCGGRGHMSRECPEKKQENDQENDRENDRGVRVVYGTPKNYKYY
jgi:hypothetical protein